MIEINNLTGSPIDEEFLKKVAERVLEGEKKGKEVLSIALIGPNRMRKLNKTYRGKNRATDVLAFGQNQKSSIFPKDEWGMGEIVICLREVKKNVKRFSSKAEFSYGIFEKELIACLIHGILHLLGYEHEKGGKATEEMERKQNYYLSQVLKP